MEKNVEKGVIKEELNIKYLDKLLNFWNKDIKKKIVIILIISVILLIIFINFVYPIIKADMILDNISLNGNSLIVKSSFIDIYKNKVYILGLTAIAGVVPYFFVTVFGMIGYLLTTASEISIKLLGYGEINIGIFSMISIILDMISISIVTSIGIYFTIVSTKKFRYSGTKRFTFLDLKLRAYEMMRKEEKIQMVKEQIEKRNLKQEKNNVKVKYLEILSVFGIALVIQAISVAIEILVR